MTVAYDAHHHDAPDEGQALGFFGIALANLLTFGILYFWIMGAVLLVTQNGGLIVELGLTGTLRTLYFAYPVIALLSLTCWLFYLARREIAALLVAGTPIALATLYYLWLVTRYYFF